MASDEPIGARLVPRDPGSHRRHPHLRAAIIVAARAAVRVALAADPWATFERQMDMPIGPAVRSGKSDWLARQVAVRRQYLRELANQLGLDPDEAICRYGGQP